MICKSNSIDLALLNKLKANHYTRKIKANFFAYGTQYDFSSIYEIIDEDKIVGLISIFNASMVISSIENTDFSEMIITEICEFILMNMSCTVEIENGYAHEILKQVHDEYSGVVRTEFEFLPRNNLPEVVVEQMPKLDDVFHVLKESFMFSQDSYELWITDTSHRIRHGLSQTFLLEECTTATIQYIVDDIALIGNVATLPKERGKFHARRLLYWLGEKITVDGLRVKLFARPHRVTYYEEILFKEIGTDMVLERKNND